MLRLFNTKPCTEQAGHIQAEGEILDPHFSIALYESLLSQFQFSVFSLGNPKTLVCKRKDFMLFINSDQTFSLTQVNKNIPLEEVLSEIERCLTNNPIKKTSS